MMIPKLLFPKMKAAVATIALGRLWTAVATRRTATSLGGPAEATINQPATGNWSRTLNFFSIVVLQRGRGDECFPQNRGDMLNGKTLFPLLFVEDQQTGPLFAECRICVTVDVASRRSRFSGLITFHVMKRICALWIFYY